jgi:hypothetical protein
MNCKNCHSDLKEKANFCYECGAKVIREDITLKQILRDFIVNFFGWDNSFFKTIRTLLVRPEVLIDEYLDGVRKRYMNPFVFLTIGTAISLFIFNSYSEVFIDSNAKISNFQMELMKDALGEDFANSEEFQDEVKKNQEIAEESAEFTVKYFNVMTFIFIPFYAFLTMLVFGRKYSFGEYIIMTCYIQGILFYSTILFFALSIFLDYQLLTFSLLVTIPYYLYVFGRLLKLNLWQLLVKLLKFILFLFLFLIGLVIVGIIVSIAVILISKLFEIS